MSAWGGGRAGLGSSGARWSRGQGSSSALGLSEEVGAGQGRSRALRECVVTHHIATAPHGSARVKSRQTALKWEKAAAESPHG